MTLARHVVDLGGTLHYLDSGGEGPPTVLVHGLAGSSINWLPAAELLRRHRRVLALDLAGFGLTPPENRGVHLRAQRKLLDRFIREVAGQPVLLMGNSMGGVISILQAAEAPDTVEGLVLVNPAAPLNPLKVRDPRLLSLGLMVLPGVGDRLARRVFHRGSIETYVREFFGFVCHSLDTVDPDLLAAHIELARQRRHMPWAISAFRQATGSLINTLHSRGFVRAVKAVRAPTLLVHGCMDRLISLAAAQKLAGRRPDWHFETLDAIGHVPQIECPGQFVQTVEAWWQRVSNDASADELADPTPDVAS